MKQINKQEQLMNMLSHLTQSTRKSLLVKTIVGCQELMTQVVRNLTDAIFNVYDSNYFFVLEWEFYFLY